MANVYIVEAITNGGGAASLPSLASMSPPNPPTLAYFQSKSAKFANLTICPLQPGIQRLLVRPDTDTVLVYADGNASVHTGTVPGHVMVTSGITNGQYLNRNQFKSA